MTIRITLTLAALLIGAAQAKAEEANWHLLTKSHGGTVSLINGLTKAQCDKLACDVRIACNAPSGSMWMSSAGDIETAECFQ